MQGWEETRLAGAGPRAARGGAQGTASEVGRNHKFSFIPQGHRPVTCLGEEIQGARLRRVRGAGAHRACQQGGGLACGGAMAPVCPLWAGADAAGAAAQLLRSSSEALTRETFCSRRQGGGGHNGGGQAGLRKVWTEGTAGRAQHAHSSSCAFCSLSTMHPSLALPVQSCPNRACLPQAAAESRASTAAHQSQPPTHRRRPQHWRPWRHGGLPQDGVHLLQQLQQGAWGGVPAVSQSAAPHTHCSATLAAMRFAAAEAAPGL